MSRSWLAAHIVFFFTVSGAPACRPPPPLHETAALLSARGQDAEAVALVRKHLNEHPDDVSARRLLIRLLGAQGEIGKAEAELRELSRRLPADNPVPWIERGHVLELAHRYDEALAMYDRAAEVSPKDPEGPRVGGLRAARWGEPAVALPRLSEALRRDPRDAEAWHALGLVRAHMGDFTGAKQAYESGLMADPEALENRIGLATVALAEKRPAVALAEYDRVLERRPRFASGHLGRAWALLLLGRFDEAEHALVEGERLGAQRSLVERQRSLIGSLRQKKEHVDNP